MTHPDDGSALPGDNQHPRWWIYRGTRLPRADFSLTELLPPPPPWRTFSGGPVLPSPPHDDVETLRRLGSHLPTRTVSEFARREAEMVNAALLLRRPLLVSGRPGTGKSSLAYRVSRELCLGRVLRWHITSRTTLQRGLYDYDAIGRVQDTAAARAALGQGPSEGEDPTALGIGEYLQLGPLGTALLPYAEPRVLLIDELDKSDLDLANDLLSIFEEGSFTIPELLRARRRHPVVRVLTNDPEGEAEIRGGTVTCNAFPLVVMTSNSEREFPPAFLRRCLLLEMPDPSQDDLADMLAAHFGEETARQWGGDLIARFLERSRERGGLSRDQLLNSLYLATSGGVGGQDGSLYELVEAVWHRLDRSRSGTKPG
ncbi:MULTISPECIES: AAA family ATPase [unclassified Streptomyces]|uniref:AAA family ATPase n=1 Tax=unclassified Streptomyces TaxID=2593676 RepID=UPI00225384FB|nr:MULTISPECIES: AAA family ATPase [unclassified Streptomyces]MCX4987874.1 AAA family ATPase [Streptomyces sp. NBC_00568]MCX5006994.1 AAA family ATPase [Streptomyces sp. NBC_00638]